MVSVGTPKLGGWGNKIEIEEYVSRVKWMHCFLLVKYMCSLYKNLSNNRKGNYFTPESDRKRHFNRNLKRTKNSVFPWSIVAMLYIHMQFLVTWYFISRRWYLPTQSYASWFDLWLSWPQYSYLKEATPAVLI